MTNKLKPELEKYVEDLKVWVEDRKKSIQYSIEQFDKLIITLSSGSLALSIGFVKDIVNITSETNTFILKSSWYSLALSLISVLISQITSYKSHKIETDISEDEIYQYENFQKYDSAKQKVKKWLVSFYNRLTISFNVISFLTLIIGIVLFIIFINQNL